MRILLFGKSGQVGWELQRSLACLGEVHALDQDEADFSRPNELTALLDRLQPDVIVNAAAYTAVDKAETEFELARRINADSVAVLAAWAARHSGWLIHYSTDYVFDGKQSGFYVETDKTNPLSVYGQTKLEGEEAIRQSGCRHLIFRTSWVYAVLGNNFAKTMLHLAASRESLSVVADQWGAPTSAELLADVTAHCLYRLKMASNTIRYSGTYHLVAGGETHWCDYARLVLGLAQEQGLTLKVDPSSVQAIPTSEYPTPAQRPLNSRLATNKIQATFDVLLPDWKFHVRRQVRELIQYQEVRK
jgi:dTDP-4-dehydrorhamnose reductase